MRTAGSFFEDSAADERTVAYCESCQRRKTVMSAFVVVAAVDDAKGNQNQPTIISGGKQEIVMIIGMNR